MAQVGLLLVLSVGPQPILATGVRGETPKREASATPEATGTATQASQRQRQSGLSWDGRQEEGRGAQM